MIIYDFNVMRIALAPGKADAPPVVDSNAVRPRTVAFQQLQLVPRRRAKILQPQCPMQVQELPPRRPFHGLESPNPAVLKERRGVWALERTDQVSAYYVVSVMSNVISGKAAPTQPGAPPEASVEKCGVLENRSAARPAGCSRVSDLEAVLYDPTI
jgi:hypothetical protein